MTPTPASWIERPGRPGRLRPPLCTTRPSAVRTAPRRAGFTLIELVSAIAILAVLGAVAAPKMFNLVTVARNTSVTATEDAFAQAVRIAQFACLASLWRNKDNLPGYGNGNVDFNSACLPTDTSNQNLIGGQAARCMRVWNAILNPAPSIQTGTAGNADFRALASGEVCRYRYLEVTPVVEFRYDAQSGTVD